MCQMPNIWHIWHTKHKNRVLLDVPNLKNYATLLQYHLKYEMVRTTMAKWDTIILLRFSLSSSIYISLRQLYLISSLSVTLYLFPLLPAQESCSRSLSRKLPLISPPHASVLVDLVGFGFVIGFWFGFRLWVVSQVTSMFWVEVVGCDFDGLIQVIWVEVMGCGRIMDHVWDWVLIWIEVLGWALMAWFRWEVSHGDCAVFVVVIERWKRKVGGGWIVGFGCGWWLVVEKWWKTKVVRVWIVFFFLLPVAVVCGCGWWGNGGNGCCCCVVMVWFGLVFFFFFPLLLRFLDLEFVAVVDRRWCCCYCWW